MEKVKNIYLTKDHSFKWKTPTLFPVFETENGIQYCMTLGYPDGIPTWVPRYSRIVLLNASILTSEGNFDYKEIDIDEFKKLTDSDIELVSAIGHESTAEILTEIVGKKIKVNRVDYKQKPTDLCLVLKLDKRPEEGVILTKEEMTKIGFSLYKLIKKD